MRSAILGCCAIVVAALPLPAQERLTLHERSLGGIQTLRYSPDGSRLAVGFLTDSALRVYPTAGGTPLVIPNAFDVQFAPLFTPDGRSVISRRQLGLVVFDAATGEPRQALTEPGFAGIAAASPDHRTLAVAASDGSLRLLDFTDFRERLTLQRGAPAVITLALSRDGQTLATLHPGGIVRIWKDGKQADRFDIEARVGQVFSPLAFSNDGSKLLIGGYGVSILRDLAARKSQEIAADYVRLTSDGTAIAAHRETQVRLLDMAGKELRTIPLRIAKKTAGDLFVEGPGRSVLLQFPDGELVLRDLRDGGMDAHSIILRPATASGHPVIALTPDGRTALIAEPTGALRFFDADVTSPTFGKELAAVERKGAQPIAALIVSPDSRRAVAVSANAVHLWDVAARREIGDKLSVPLLTTLFRFSADSSVLTAIGAGGIRRWEAATGKRLAPYGAEPIFASALTTLPAGPTPTPLGLAMTFGVGAELKRWENPAAEGAPVNTVLDVRNDSLAMVDRRNRLVLFDLAGDTETELQRPAPQATALGFSLDGRLLATRHEDNALRLWDTATGKALGEPIPLALRQGTEVLFSHSQQRVLVFAGGPAEVCDLKTRRSLALVTANHFGLTHPQFSPDDALIYLTEQDLRQLAWDAVTGKLVTQTTPGPTKNLPVTMFVVSPNGTHAAAFRPGATMLIWDLAHPGNPVMSDGILTRVKELRFSPDGRVLAEAGMDGTIRLWAVDTGKLLKELRQHKQRIAQVVFSPDGKLLVAEAGDSSGSIWSVDPSAADFGTIRSIVADLHATNDTGQQVWSADSKQLAVLINTKVPRILDAKGAIRQTLPLHDANISEMTFTPDGRTLWVRTISGTIRAWDCATGKAAALPAELAKQTTAFAFSPDGWLAAGTDDHVFVWGGAGAKAPVELAAAGRVENLQFSADGQTLVARATGLHAWRLNRGTWQPVSAQPPSEGGPFLVVEVAGDGRAVLLRTNPYGELMSWDVDSGKATLIPAGPGGLPAHFVPGKSSQVLIHSIRSGGVNLANLADDTVQRLYAPAATVNSSATSPDGRITVTGSIYSSLDWYTDGDRRRPRYTMDVDYVYGGVVRLSFSPDGKRLVTSNLNALSVWSCTRPPKLLLSEATAGLIALQWSPDGSKLAIGGYDGECKVLDLDHRQATTLEPGRLMVIHLGLSRDGRTLAVLDIKKTVRVYDTTGKGVLMTLPSVAGVALSPDGQWLATVEATTGEVHLHDIRSGKDQGPLTTFKATLAPPAVQFTPDGRTLAVGCTDGWYRHFDVATKTEGKKFPWCVSVVFSGDSRWRIGATPDGMVKMWDVATGDEKKEHWPGGGQLQVSTDGRWLLQQTNLNTLKLIDTAGGPPVDLFKEAGFINSCLLTPDGKTVIAVTGNQTLHFWDVARGSERATASLKGSGWWGGGMLCVSDDSRTICFSTGGGNGGLRAWDVASAHERAAVTVARNDPTTQYQLSGDGSTLAVNAADGALRIYDIRSAEEKTPLAGHGGPVTAVAVTGDGKLAVTAGEDRTVRLYDPGTPARPAFVLRGSRAPVLGVAISPDGKTIAATSADGTVRLWPRAMQDDLLTLTGHTGWAVRLFYLPDGKRALSSGRDGLRLWDLEKGTLIRHFAEGQSNEQLGLSHDGTHCLTPDKDNNIREFDLATGKESRQFKGQVAFSWVVLYLPGDKEVLAAATDGKIFVWDRATGEKVREFERTGQFSRCGAVSPDGKYLATGDCGGRGTVRIWDLATGKPLRHFGDSPSDVTWVVWAPDGKRLLSTGADGTLRIWEAETGKELRLMRQKTWIDTAAWLPDGKRVLSTANTGDNGVTLWDVEDGKVLHYFQGHTQSPITAAIAPDGRTALTTGKDGTVRMWNLANRDAIVLPGHEGEVWAAAFSPDSKQLATAGADKMVRLWDVSGNREAKGYGRLLRTLEGASMNLFAVAFSPDGKRIAAGEGDLFATFSAGAVRVWNVDSGELTATLRGHNGAIRAVAFSPDGKLLASGGADKTIRLWNVADGTSKQRLTGHAATVMGLAFDRKGALLASAGANPLNPADSGEVLLWDLANGRQRGPLMGHRSGLTGVAISADDGSVLASSYDGTVRVWVLPR